MRGTYVFDNLGIIRHASINQNSVGRNIDALEGIVESIKYFDQKGESCPANWSKGQPAIESQDWNSEKLNNFWQNVHAKK